MLPLPLLLLLLLLPLLVVVVMLVLVQHTWADIGAKTLVADDDVVFSEAEEARSPHDVAPVFMPRQPSARAAAHANRA